MAVKILNFAHPLTDVQLEQVYLLLKGHEELELEVVDVKVQLDLDEAIEPQIAQLVDSVDVNWESDEFIVNLPGLAPAAAVIIAELHGRSGYFPTIMRLKPVGTPPRWDVAEVINLQAVRAVARELHRR